MTGLTFSNRNQPRSKVNRTGLSGYIFRQRLFACADGVKQHWLPGLRNDSGATLVEFAISFSVVLMMLFGIIQCCLMVYTLDYVSDAARQATRYAIVRGSNCTGMPDCGINSAGIQTYLQGVPYPGINMNSLTATTTWLSASSTQPTTWTACGTQCNSPGNAVQVHVTYGFPLDIPFWKNTTINLSSTSQMVISN